MRRAELVTPQLAPRPEHPAQRFTRAGARAANAGFTLLAAAAQLNQLRGARDDAARERAKMLRDVAARMVQLHGITVDTRGPLPLGPVILAANHLSWIDPLVIASLLPCVPISKAEVRSWPVIGTIGRELGVVFVSRGDPYSGWRALRQAQKALDTGLSVLNFPEGTTSTGQTVLPFHRGVFGIARHAGVPVVPVAIAYDPPELAWVGDDAFLPHWLQLAGSRRAHAFVRLGAPMSPRPYPSAEEFTQAVRAKVDQLLNGG